MANCPFRPITHRDRLGKGVRNLFFFPAVIVAIPKDQAHCPPGLAKKGCVPPGQQKKGIPPGHQKN